LSIQYHTVKDLEEAVQKALDATTQTVIPTVVQTALDLKLTTTAQTALTADVVTPANFTVSSLTVSDTAIQATTASSPIGFVSTNEADSFIAIVKNLHSRVSQLEARLVSLGLLVAS